ncbi:hypothetical protein DRW07_04125 [Alteromonas sediminis]|uniref:PPM-type phosphatase domain-containing protein n=1 Tax=Alteromonas sediminis TaxID=2259342 RepID=A0A3N5ZE68_9ALTE|nr:SpoIIE family protein phosphatase [Alteromonas sediminis]RPJ68598.1 hypothetical protein DRW07_04125 [Alteromonas sediminis]
MPDTAIEYEFVDEVDASHTNEIQAVIASLNTGNTQLAHASICLLHVQVLSRSALAKLHQRCAEHVDSKLVLLTPDNSQSKLVMAYESGIEEHILLPVDKQLLTIKLHNLIREQNAQYYQAEKNQQLESILTRIQQEESFAQHVYQEISGNAINVNKDYYFLQRSAEGFCGDFLFDIRSPTGIRYVFLADAMGHGLAAALSMLPVINVVKAMAHRSMPISSIVHEVNRRLNSELPADRFVALAAIEVSPFSEKITVINAGLPSIFVADKNGELQECESKSLPLGIVQGNEFTIKPDVFSLQTMSSLLMYTDGLIEQENAHGESISKHGLKEALLNLTANEQPWEGIAEQFNKHTGEQELSDDVTLCAIDFDVFELEVQAEQAGDKREGNIAFTLEISGDYLNSVDAPAFVSKFLYAAGLEGKLAGKTFTAVAELYQNGLDHGVLELDSSLKNDTDGFIQYLSEREIALSTLSSNDCVTLSLSYSASGGVEASVSDTGKGYDTSKIEPDQFSMFGRGLALVKQLSESCVTNKTGNEVKVVIKE